MVKRLSNTDQNDNKLENIPTPINDGDAANKKYVDDNSGGGSGDVIGPVSATDNSIVRFDGTTGKQIQEAAYLTIPDGQAQITAGSGHDFVLSSGLNIQLNASDVVDISGNNLATNAIIERTSGSGVTIDGVLIKDGLVDGKDVSTLGVGDVTISGSQTVTNKRINPRVISAASASTLTPSIASADQYAYTALATNLTIAAPTGTPVDGNKLIFRIKDNGTSRTLMWDSVFRAIGTTLPTATTIGKTLYVGAIYNSTDTKWDVIAVAEEA